MVYLNISFIPWQQSPRHQLIAIIYIGLTNLTKVVYAQYKNAIQLKSVYETYGLWGKASFYFLLKRLC